MRRIHSFITTATLVLGLAACGTSKQIDSATKAPSGTESPTTVARENPKVRELAFVQRVSDNRVYASDIVAQMTFTAQLAGNDVTLPGTIHMRRDQVIRLQLMVPLLGTEVGRLEFTPDYVLVVDRLHKEYIKADYQQLDFMRQNGLNFYTLQSLFWGQLFLPNNTRVGEGDLQRFSADLERQDGKAAVMLNNGALNFLWTANASTAQIEQTDVTYQSAKQGKSTLTWEYSNFQLVGSKRFPATQLFKFSTEANTRVKTGLVKMEMGTLRTEKNWEALTTVSDRYKRVEATDLFGKLLDL